VQLRSLLRAKLSLRHALEDGDEVGQRRARLTRSVVCECRAGVVEIPE
jgi:hypothetical protein